MLRGWILEEHYIVTDLDTSFVFTSLAQKENSMKNKQRRGKRPLNSRSTQNYMPQEEKFCKILLDVLCSFLYSANIY